MFQFVHLFIEILSKWLFFKVAVIQMCPKAKRISFLYDYASLPSATETWLWSIRTHVDELAKETKTVDKKEKKGSGMNVHSVLLSLQVCEMKWCDGEMYRVSDWVSDWCDGRFSQQNNWLQIIVKKRELSQFIAYCSFPVAVESARIRCSLFTAELHAGK